MGLYRSTAATHVGEKKYKYKCMLLNGLEDFVDPKSTVPLSERKDLPEEAKALLITIDILRTKKGGGLKTSRWHTPSDCGSVRAPLPILSSLDPKAKEFKILHGYTPPECDSIAVLSTTSSSLNPRAKEFAPSMSRATPTTTSSTRAMRSGLTSSKWAEGPHKGTSSLASVAKPTVTTSANSPCVGVWIPPHLRAAQDATSQMSTRCIPQDVQVVHRTKTVNPSKTDNNYVPPHLRSKFSPEDASLTPNSAIDVVSSSESYPIPNRAPPAYRVPPNYSGATRPTANNPTAPTPAAFEANRHLASSWEEFTCGKNYYTVSAPTQVGHGRPLATITNTTHNRTSAPLDKSVKSPVVSREVAVFSKQHHSSPDVGTTAVKPPHSPSSTKGSRYSIEELIEHGKQPALMKPKVIPAAQMYNISSPAARKLGLETAAQIHAVLMNEIRSPEKAVVSLTREALIKNIGAAPRDSVGSRWDQAVSDDGVEDHDENTKANSINDSRNKQQSGDIRGVIGADHTGLQDWDGKWAAIPCSWEHERGTFDNEFVPQFIASWREALPELQSKVDMNCDEFTTGLSPLCNLRFAEPVQQPLCYPDVVNSENIHKQRIQTAEIDSKQRLRVQIRRQREQQRQAVAETQRILYFANLPPEPNPNAPAISIYLRPAQEKDIPGITAIYNHYVVNSIVPEDQEPVTEEDIHTVWRNAREDLLPVIVAIRGAPPTNGRAGDKELVVGFARADNFFGLGGSNKGRSRSTAVIDLYVHKDFLRKGVGRCLLDRILQCISPLHGGKDGYDWINLKPEDQQVYGMPGGGGRRYHQIQLHRAIEIRDDPDHGWLKKWLESKFYFFQVARFLSTARSPVRGRARFLDQLVFQLEASNALEFDMTA